MDPHENFARDVSVDNERGLNFRCHLLLDLDPRVYLRILQLLRERAFPTILLLSLEKLIGSTKSQMCLWTRKSTLNFRSLIQTLVEVCVFTIIICFSLTGIWVRKESRHRFQRMGLMYRK